MPKGSLVWFYSKLFFGVATLLLGVLVAYNQYYMAGIGAALLIVLYKYGHDRQARQQQEMSVYLAAMTHNIDQASYYALQNLPLAILLVDKSGIVHWCNKVLIEWIDDKAIEGHSILKVWPELPLDGMWNHAGQHVMTTGDKHYHIIYKAVDETAEKLMILYITDITIHEIVRTEYAGAMPVLAHVQIDNYDDVLHGLGENQRSALVSEINNCLTEWIAGLDGFIKKHSKDLYLVIINRRALDKVLKDKFDILDKVRAIHGGNKIPVTLSMGVAVEEETVAGLAKRAQAGLDLALGRGGDQVAVYIDGKVQFYGGKAKAVEKNTRVKVRLVAQAIREIMDDADRVLVMGHANEDFDSLGAAMGVAKMARYLGKSTNIVISQPGVAIDKLAELLLDYEEYSDIFITQEQALQISTPKTMLFVVDTHRPELTAAPELLKLVERAVVIDHHRRAEKFIENPLLTYLEPSASSASELVTELLMYFDDNLELTRSEASALYAGIVVDTKNFAVQVGVRTFDAAAYLRRAGADPTLVRHLFRLDFETMRSRAEIIQHTELLGEGLAVSVCPVTMKNANISAAQAADMLLWIEDIILSVVLFVIEDGVGICARSQGEVNVQLLMEEFGGGGHQTVAGAQVKKLSIEEVKRKVIELSVNYIRESGYNETNSTTRG